MQATGINHKTGLFSSKGHATKPVTWATIAIISTMTLTNLFDSRELRERRPKIAGIKQTQLVIMAPLTTSSSGRILKNNIAKPIVCSDSEIKICKQNKKRN